MNAKRRCSCQTYWPLQHAHGLSYLHTDTCPLEILNQKFSQVFTYHARCNDKIKKVFFIRHFLTYWISNQIADSCSRVDVLVALSAFSAKHLLLLQSATIAVRISVYLLSPSKYQGRNTKLCDFQNGYKITSFRNVSADFNALLSPEFR